ncbi:MAG: dTDP-4-dehydrorhamnose 3,5-epimerase [uncultured Phycisphaerae bacterium]|uniref:dTDP-4-dehydrorhamnose 3,5-epimerase n=1 Tax=uncultured Phycisphaerae bacterium TaxID=904963 RepID=A0A6J4PRZ1_9BACT|nr:MAG: dTDP-4-dehydrorhamnose 3,5-epimerase [uncultured Phycisphaerae bacterium]
MQVVPTAIPDVKVLVPKKFGDHRGFFSETYSRKAFEALGLRGDFVQDNHSLSAEAGVVRGLHYQLPPMAQDKLLRVVRGAVLDVAVDVRRSSPTFGRHVTAVLSAENWNQIYVPAGFAHGFRTLEPNTEVLYKVTAFYSPEHERGVRWDDPALGVDWRVTAAAAVLSDRDRRHPPLAEARELFE